MACVFCDIAIRATPAHVVFDDEDFFAFLDIRPLFLGHTLLIPKRHYVTLPDVPAPLVGPLFERAQTLCETVTSELGAEGTFVAMNNVVSQSVAHLHVHVVPRTKGDGLRGFFWPRTKYDNPEHAAEIAGRLRERYEAR